MHFADIKASTNKILNLNCRSGDGQRALIGTCAICLDLDTALNIRICPHFIVGIERFKRKGFLAGGTCALLLVMTRANSKANKVFLLLFMCFTSIIRRYFSGALRAK